jgi:hypothetical protein
VNGSQVDEQFFTTTYINGLKEDIRAMVELHTPSTVRKATTIAKIQEGHLERTKSKFQRQQSQTKPTYPKPDSRPNPTYGTLWRNKQLRDYRKANNLGYSCGEKFEPGHSEVCTKREKPHVNAMIVNHLDKELDEEPLNEIAIEELLNEDFCELSLNALAGTESANSIKLHTTVKNKTMLTLVDSGSSHSFVSVHFVHMANLPTTPIPKQKVKLANGEWMTAAQQVPDLTWYIQGHTFTYSMIVLDLLPYDSILGYDWLEKNSPMECDWANKTLQFHHQGNDIWAYVL